MDPGRTRTDRADRTGNRLEIHGGDRSLAWTRDALDAFRFKVAVPEGVGKITADFDYLSPQASYGSGGYGNTPNMTPHLAIVLFNHVLLLPDLGRCRHATGARSCSHPGYLGL
jgi:hypothetical protein